MRFRITTLVSITLGMLMIVPHQAMAAENDRVLLVVSGYGADDGKTRPGFEMDELTQAWAVFTDNGFEVDIASPSGGTVVADGFNPRKPYNSRFLADPEAAAELASTRSLADLGEEKYAAVFVIGGKGAMFDLPISVPLKTLLAETYRAGGVIGAVCHGPAVFMNVSLEDGTSLLEGRAVTGFSNEEEALFGKGWALHFPILLENGLRGSGAVYSEAPMMLTHVVADGRLVTGQNPYSTAAAAEAMIRAMGRPLAPRQPWADERSIALLLKMLSGEGDQARAAFKADPSLYDVPLIAMWGLFRSRTVGADREALSQAVDIMELALPHFDKPELAAAIAEARSRLAAKQ